MIDKDEVKKILNGNAVDNVICHDFELRPTAIAPDIKRLANIADDYGYIIIGAFLYLYHIYVFRAYDCLTDLNLWFN